MLEFQTPQISAEDVEDNHGTFTIEPLDRGFGYTFGNSLRRVLLSSLAGAAVTSVRIEGVAHEFSTISGVKEMVETSWATPSMRTLDTAAPASEERSTRRSELPKV